jgi:hypothetical protein
VKVWFALEMCVVTMPGTFKEPDAESLAKKTHRARREMRQTKAIVGRSESRHSPFDQSGPVVAGPVGASRDFEKTAY